MKYHAHIDLSNKNNSHTLAFDQIMEHADGKQLKILEVGCSSGYFGSALKQHGHEVWGVEPSTEAANLAQDLLDHVHNGLIEDFYSKHPDTKFDVVVFGDVLEHLNDPVAALQECSRHLYDNGLIVASIPNVAHGAVRLMLLEGRWDYSELGILDRTHLHFFTQKSIVNLFQKAGYFIERIDSVSLSIEHVNSMCAMNLNPQSIELSGTGLIDTHAFVFQYIVSAKKQDSLDQSKVSLAFKCSQSPRIACFVSDPNSSLVSIRLRRQLQYWTSITGGEVRILSLSELTKENLQWGDIYVFQREANRLIEELTLSLQNAGKKIIFDIDDYLFEVPDHLAHHRTYLNENQSHLKSILSKVDAISVSTIELRDKLTSLNSNLFITPNFSEYSGFSAAHTDTDPIQANLIIASSDMLHLDMLLEPLQRIQSSLNVKIVAIGPFVEKLQEAGLQIESSPNVDLPGFRRLISSYANPIGIIPLDSSAFSTCKSAVMYFDYSMCGIPSICSNVPPYSTVITNEVDGLLVANTSEEWHNAILKLVSSTSSRIKIAAAAKNNTSKKHSLKVAGEAWKSMVDSLLPLAPKVNVDANNPPWPINKIKEAEETAEEYRAINQKLLQDYSSLLDVHRRTIDDYENSTSWRLTAPLRALSKLTRKISRR